MKKNLKIISVLLTGLIATGSLTSCTQPEKQAPATTTAATTAAATQEAKKEEAKPAEKKELSILSITFTGTPAAANEPTVVALEELSGYKLKIDYILNSSYEDQLNTRMAGGNLPALVAITGKTASVISNARAGAFWDITDEYKNYPNLAEANPVVMNNISIDGKYYGIYRARPLGRNAISYRKDWLANVGMEEPKTIDDLYNVLKAFTEKDPDQNGKNDTYGMTWCKWGGPLDQLNVAFGGYNKWGIGEDGKLAPEFTTPMYMDAMNFAKKLYDEGLVNKDFAAMETSDWQNDFKNEKSGVYIDVSDQAHRFQEYFTKEKSKEDNVWVIPMVEGPKGRFSLPTTGNAGFVAISKSGAKTEQDMKDALNFIDITNSVEGQNLLNFGVEGIHYNKKPDGTIETIKFDPDPREGLNQIMTNVVDKLYPLSLTPIRIQNAAVQKENLNYIVPDPCAPFTSNTYADKGAQLDQLITDARVQYIVGQIDEAGFKKVIEQWYAQGGENIVKEYNEAYAAVKK